MADGKAYSQSGPGPELANRPTDSDARAVSVRTQWRSGLVEFGAVAALLAVTLARSLTTTELYFYDETAYLARGLSGQADFTNGATYSDLYWLTGHLVANPVDLYFVVRAMAAAALVMGVWFAARLLADPRLAWVAGVVIAATPAPYIWPGVAAPAAATVLAGLAMLFRWPGLSSLGLALCLFWGAAGARPEYVWWVAAVSVLAVAAVLYRSLTSSRATWSSAGSYAVVCGALIMPAALVLLHGSPFNGSGRQWAAFGQHFAQRNAVAPEDPWLDWETIAGRSFGDASSIGEAFWASPKALFGHIARNVAEAPSAFVTEVLGGGHSMATTSLGWPLLIILVVGVAVSLLWDTKASRTRAARLARGVMSREYRLPVLVFALLLVATAIPTLVVYPRGHYLVLAAGLFVLLLVVIQSHVGSSYITWLIPVLATVIGFAFLLVQTAGAVTMRLDNPPPRPEAIQIMASSDRQWRLVGSDWGEYGLDVYVEGVTEVPEEPLVGETFSQFLTRNRVNAVLLNDRLADGPLGSSPGFDGFAADPRTYGFVELVPQSQIWVKPA